MAKINDLVNELSKDINELSYMAGICSGRLSLIIDLLSNDNVPKLKLIHIDSSKNSQKCTSKGRKGKSR